MTIIKKINELAKTKQENAKGEAKHKNKQASI